MFRDIISYHTLLYTPNLDNGSCEAKKAEELGVSAGQGRSAFHKHKQPAEGADPASAQAVPYKDHMRIIQGFYRVRIKGLLASCEGF